jgi:hypothetical protein
MFVSERTVGGVAEAYLKIRQQELQRNSHNQLRRPLIWDLNPVTYMKLRHHFARYDTVTSVATRRVQGCWDKPLTLLLLFLVQTRQLRAPCLLHWARQ